MKKLFALFALLGMLNGCASYQAGTGNSLIRASYDAADLLVKQMPVSIAQDAPIIVATFVDINRLTESSTLGRMMAEQVAARLTQRGYPIIELKLRGSAYVREGKGELMLSREVKDLSQEYKVQAVVVGTYAASADRVFLNMKIVRPTDNRVLAAQDVAVIADEQVLALLMQGAR